MNIYITGPTASGKTKTAIEISKITKLRIFNCDSRQFWKNMKKITCSPSESELLEAPHYMFNYLKNEEKPSLGRWIKDLPEDEDKIIVGGTSFYIYSLLLGIPKIDISAETKKKCSLIDDKLKFLKDNLKEKLPSHIIQSDTYRIERLTEFFIETGLIFEDYKNKRKEEGKVIIINPSSEFLKRNVLERIENNIDEWIEEVSNNQHENFKTIIGYQECLEFINNNITKETLINEILVKTIQYIKFQKKFLKKFLKLNNVFQFESYNEAIDWFKTETKE